VVGRLAQKYEKAAPKRNNVQRNTKIMQKHRIHKIEN
jgi:hypothetical protein